MKLAIATDHAGYDFKEGLAAFLRSKGHEVEDLGAYNKQPSDYPDYAGKLGRYVVEGKARFGILICGSGIGMTIAANKVHGVRAALCHDLYTARMSRSHNDANVMVLPSRLLALTISEEMTELFLATEFEGGRHAGRVDKIMRMDACGGAAEGE
ncbi:MAG TPA: ribose 5-phosphate isomerase B [bacterium]|jgi:ribose 5-phosphate isomerase B|nr:ribose 5-phosphate isomerase B [bacterium]